MEKVYKTMRNIGSANIAMGIIIAITGMAVGTMAIVTGAVLLKRKTEITF